MTMPAPLTDLDRGDPRRELIEKIVQRIQVQGRFRLTLPVLSSQERVNVLWLVHLAGQVLGRPISATLSIGPTDHALTLTVKTESPAVGGVDVARAS